MDSMSYLVGADKTIHPYRIGFAKFNFEGKTHGNTVIDGFLDFFSETIDQPGVHHHILAFCSNTNIDNIGRYCRYRRN